MKIDHTIKLPDNNFRFSVTGIGSYSSTLRASISGYIPNDIDIQYPSDYMAPVKRLTKISQVITDKFPELSPDDVKDVMEELDLYDKSIRVIETTGDEIVEKYKVRVKKITDAYKLLLTNLLDQMADEIDDVSEQIVTETEARATALAKEKLK